MPDFYIEVASKNILRRRASGNPKVLPEMEGNGMADKRKKEAV